MTRRQAGGAGAVPSGAAYKRTGMHPGGVAKDIREQVDRDDKNAMLDSLNAMCVDKAHNAKGAVARPPSPASSQPGDLVAHHQLSHCSIVPLLPDDPRRVWYRAELGPIVYLFSRDWSAIGPGCQPFSLHLLAFC